MMLAQIFFVAVGSILVLRMGLVMHRAHFIRRPRPRCRQYVSIFDILAGLIVGTFAGGCWAAALYVGTGATWWSFLILAAGTLLGAALVPDLSR
jgi:hypothetical protein